MRIGAKRQELEVIGECRLCLKPVHGILDAAGNETDHEMRSGEVYFCHQCKRHFRA